MGYQEAIAILKSLPPDTFSQQAEVIAAIENNTNALAAVAQGGGLAGMNRRLR